MTDLSKTSAFVNIPSLHLTKRNDFIFRKKISAIVNVEKQLVIGIQFDNNCVAQWLAISILSWVLTNENLQKFVGDGAPLMR